MQPSGDVAVLVSPAAGRGRAGVLATHVLAAFSAAGLTPRLLPATTGAEGERQAARAVADGVAAVVAVGGDGTVHAALQAVAGTAVPLAVVPAGTGNDLVRALGIPAEPVAAARAAAEDLAAGEVRTVDAGRTGDRWWATVLCCGFDSAVSDRANRLRWPRGRRRYDVAVLAELARLRPRELTLVLDGEAQHAARDHGRRRQHPLVRRRHEGVPGRRSHRRALRRHGRRGDHPAGADPHQAAADRWARTSSTRWSRCTVPRGSS